jgi:hypothetical protein
MKTSQETFVNSQTYVLPLASPSQSPFRAASGTRLTRGRDRTRTTNTRTTLTRWQVCPTETRTRIFRLNACCVDHYTNRLGLSACDVETMRIELIPDCLQGILATLVHESPLDQPKHTSDYVL